MKSLKIFLKRYAILLFFPLTYLLSWWSVLVPQAGRGILPQGPAFAALLLVAATEGRAGLADWWKRITNWRVSWIWYLMAPTLMLAFQLSGAGLNLLMGSRLHSIEWAALWSFILVLVFMGGQWEELGWTAYALPKLQERFADRPLLASLILGALRAVWHLPLMFSGAIPWYDVLFLSFAMQFTISWLYNRTHGSSLIVILFHFTSNVLGAVMRQLFQGADWTRGYIFFIVVACVWATLLVFMTRGQLGTGTGQSLEQPAGKNQAGSSALWRGN